MIPNKKNKEWGDLIKNKIKPDLKSYSLKMQLNSIRQLYRFGKLSIDEAVNDLYDHCLKYEKIYTEDIKSIFNSKVTA